MRAMAKSRQSASVVRVGINGFGRVGRCVARALSTQAGDGLRLVAINSPSGAQIGAHLLRHDSTHGIFAAEVEAVGDSIKIDGRKIPFTTAREIPSLRWPAVDVALECSGRFNSRAAAAAHLQNGAAAVAVSAPVEDADATVAPGINDGDLPKAARVVSAGSCTTNCLAPIAVVLREAVGIESGLMSTVHAATLDQRILDSSHADLRRARAVFDSIIPTKTGAAQSIGKVVPALDGKLSGIALRVPLSNVSLLDLTFVPTRKTTAAQIDAAMRQAADGALKGILAVNDLPLVSKDFNGRAESAIFDATLTRVSADGKLVKVFAWFDNEWGFAHRMLDLARLLGRRIEQKKTAH